MLAQDHNFATNMTCAKTQPHRVNQRHSHYNRWHYRNKTVGSTLTILDNFLSCGSTQKWTSNHHTRTPSLAVPIGHIIYFLSTATNSTRNNVQTKSANMSNKPKSSEMCHEAHKKCQRDSVVQRAPTSYFGAIFQMPTARALAATR